MQARLRLAVLLVPVLFTLAATSSSHSIYSIRFPDKALTAEQLVALAVSVLQEEGYRTKSTISPVKLQLQESPLWVTVQSPSAGTLELSFTQLRGGCGHNPEVAGSRAAAEKVRKAIEARLGSATAESIHKANAPSGAQ